MRDTTHPHHHAGITLLEVLAGLAILGTLFTAMLFAQRDHRSQFERAQRKMIAVEAADQLLTHWWSQSSLIPQDAAGQVAEEVPDLKREHARLSWRTQRIAQPNASRLNVQVIRLEIFTPTAANLSPQTPDAFVDFIVPAGSTHDGL